MSGQPDTNAEAVERLAALLDGMAERGDCAGPPICRWTAAALRALAAERDRLKSLIAGMLPHLILDTESMVQCQTAIYRRWTVGDPLPPDLDDLLPEARDRSALILEARATLGDAP